MTSTSEARILALPENQERLATLLDNFPGMACRCRNNPLEFDSGAWSLLSRQLPHPSSTTATRIIYFQYRLD